MSTDATRVSAMDLRPGGTIYREHIEEIVARAPKITRTKRDLIDSLYRAGKPAG